MQKMVELQLRLDEPGGMTSSTRTSYQQNPMHQSAKSPLNTIASPRVGTA